MLQELLSQGKRVLLHFHDKAESWKEEQHPRGQPENAGEFTSSKGTKKGATAPPSVKVKSASHLLVAAPDRTKWPEHIKALKLPPAWTDVKVNPDPNGALLAVGRDVKGRSQYVYSEKHAQTQAAAKYQRVKSMDAKFTDYQRRNNQNLLSESERTRDHALCMALIMDMGVRPGSERDTKADRRAYGATTLEGKHVVTDGKSTYLQFTGKKGVGLKLPVDNPQLAHQLRSAAKKAGPTGPLFPAVSDVSLRLYASRMTEGGAKPKDFRTLLANRLANQLVQSAPAPSSASGYN